MEERRKKSRQKRGEGEGKKEKRGIEKKVSERLRSRLKCQGGESGKERAPL